MWRVACCGVGVVRDYSLRCARNGRAKFTLNRQTSTGAGGSRFEVSNSTAIEREHAVVEINLKELTRVV